MTLHLAIAVHPRLRGEGYLAVHPRLRGEYIAECKALVKTSGPSPLARGILNQSLLNNFG